LLRRLYNIRSTERRDAWVGFFVLFAFIGSFAVLETARDALFLAKIEATRLPLVYLGIAGVSLIVAEAQARMSSSHTGRRALAAWLGVAAAITAAFWFGLGRFGQEFLYVLYVWSGVLSTVVLVHFWTLLGDLFSVTQAKRVYGLIGAGSVLGAIAGSGAASLIARVVEARQLVLVAAFGLVAASLISLLFRESGRTDVDGKGASKTAGLRAAAIFIWRQPYAKRIAGVMLLAASALTLADFVFKQAVAAAVPADQLGSTFATIYFGLNVLSFFTQIVVVGFVLRRFGIIAGLSVLPALLLLGGGLMIGLGGLVAALLVKGADGALRYTLHRTTTELLFVPLTEVARRKVKAFIDVVGQRGGQALASLLILGLAALAAPPWVTAIALVVLSGAWIAVVLDLRAHYLDLFRGQIQKGMLSHLEEFPDLDVGSLETLIAGLDSESDAEVTTALELLEHEGKGRLVPALILYHPSEAVVERALTLFSRTQRSNAIHVIDRLLEHPSPRVRSAAVAARSVLAHDERLLRMRLSFEESAEVRATIVVNLVASGDITGQEGHDRMQDFLARGSPQVHVAMAEAIAHRRTMEHGSVLIRLSESPEPEVRIAAARSMGVLPSPAFVTPLLRLLAEEASRSEAQKSLVAQGRDCLFALGRALEEGVLEDDILWHVPKAIRYFEPTLAAEVLQRAMPKVDDGMVRYRIIRALEHIVTHHPEIKLDRELLERTVHDTVSRAFRYLDRRLSLVRGGEEDPGRRTAGHELLVALLADKERHAIGRLFRLFVLLHPNEDFDKIYRGLMTTERDVRAGSVELVENILSGTLRHSVVALIDDGPDEERLGAAEPYHTRLDEDYGAVLGKLLESNSDALVDVTVFHVGELGLTMYRDKIASLSPRPDVELALERLSVARAVGEVELAR
jgi:ATP:ADP antiporter, AAA family